MVDISIIVPVYNSEMYLYQCLESLIDQMHKNIEIICVNDGSTDKSVEILERFATKDPRIKLFHQEKNKGTEVARRVGLSHARGKYIMFCDADDWYEPEMCQEMFNVMEIGGVDLAICKTSICKEQDENNLYNYSYYDFSVGGIEEISLSLIDTMNTVLWNKIFKRELIEEHQITFPEFKDIRVGWGDFFVLEYLLFSKKVFFLDKVLHNFRVRKDSLTGSLYEKNSNKHHDIWYGLEKFYEILEEKSLLSDDVLNFFLGKYSGKTKHYFDYMPSLEDRIKAMNNTREFLEAISYNGELIDSFKEKYLRSLMMITHNAMMKDDNKKDS